MELPAEERTLQGRRRIMDNTSQQITPIDRLVAEMQVGMDAIFGDVDPSTVKEAVMEILSYQKMIATEVNQTPEQTFFPEKVHKPNLTQADGISELLWQRIRQVQEKRVDPEFYPPVQIVQQGMEEHIVDITVISYPQEGKEDHDIILIEVTYNGQSQEEVDAETH